MFEQGYLGNGGEPSEGYPVYVRALKELQVLWKGCVEGGCASSCTSFERALITWKVVPKNPGMLSIYRR